MAAPERGDPVNPVTLNSGIERRRCTQTSTKLWAFLPSRFQIAPQTRAKGLLPCGFSNSIEIYDSGEARMNIGRRGVLELPLLHLRSFFHLMQVGHFEVPVRVVYPTPKPTNRFLE